MDYPRGDFRSESMAAFAGTGKRPAIPAALAKRLDLSGQDVGRIGWTKLAIVATAGERELGELCNGRTVVAFRAVMPGTTGAVKSVESTLNKGQRSMLEAALVKFGARRSGRSLLVSWSRTQPALRCVVQSIAQTSWLARE
jgi:hypothetical protein